MYSHTRRVWSPLASDHHFIPQNIPAPMSYVSHSPAQHAHALTTYDTLQRVREAYSRIRRRCAGHVTRGHHRTRQTRLRAQEVRAVGGALRVCTRNSVSDTPTSRARRVLTDRLRHPAAQRSSTRRHRKSQTCTSRTARRCWRTPLHRAVCWASRTRRMAWRTAVVRASACPCGSGWLPTEPRVFVSRRCRQQWRVPLILWRRGRGTPRRRRSRRSLR